MKTVFTNSMCAHVWAQLKQPHGRSGSMKFSGAVAYSYAEPVAHIITPKGRSAVALFISRRWGVTTARHISEYMSAASQFPSFTVPDIFPHYDARKIRDEAPDATLHAVNVAYLVAEYIAERDKLMRCPADSWRLADRTDSDYDDVPTRAHSSLRALALNLEEYRTAFGLLGMPCHWQSDAADVIARRDRLLNDPKRAAKRAASAAARERAEEKKEAARVEQRRLDSLGAAERVAAWRAGGPVTLRYGDVPSNVGALLRLRGDSVETSMGATAPATHVRMALEFYQRVRSGCEPRTYERDRTGASASVRLGHFALDSIDAEGNVRAGCHRIKAEEVAALAATLGVQS